MSAGRPPRCWRKPLRPAVRPRLPARLRRPDRPARRSHRRRGRLPRPPRAWWTGCGGRAVAVRGGRWREAKPKSSGTWHREFGPLPGGVWPEPVQMPWCCRSASRARAAPAGSWWPASARAARSTRTTAASSTCWPATSPPPSPTRARYEEERRRAEALAELDRAKTAFFSNVSHEFRTPLTLMLGPLEDTAGRRERPLPRRRPRTLEVVHRNALRLLKLVNTLLDFSRIEAGRVQAVLRADRPGRVHRRPGELFRSAIERAGHAADCRLPAAARAGVRGPRDVGEDRPQSPLERLQVHPRGRDRGHSALRRRGSSCAVARHRDRASRRRSCRASSSASTGSRARRGRTTRARASAWRWSRSWCSCTAARSRWRATRPRHHVPVLLPAGPAQCRGQGPAGAAPAAPPASEDDRPPYGVPKETPCWLAAPGADVEEATAGSRRARTATAAPAPGDPGRGRAGRACWSPTTTRTCGSTWAACWRRLTRSRWSPTGRPRGPPPANGRRTWCWPT